MKVSCDSMNVESLLNNKTYSSIDNIDNIDCSDLLRAWEHVTWCASSHGHAVLVVQVHLRQVNQFKDKYNNLSKIFSKSRIYF